MFGLRGVRGILTVIGMVAYPTPLVKCNRRNGRNNPRNKEILSTGSPAVLYCSSKRRDFARGWEGRAKRIHFVPRHSLMTTEWRGSTCILHLNGSQPPSQRLKWEEVSRLHLRRPHQNRRPEHPFFSSCMKNRRGKTNGQRTGAPANPLGAASGDAVLRAPENHHVLES